MTHRIIILGLLWVCLLTWTTSWSDAVNNNCCLNGFLRLNVMNCSNEMRIQLSCPYGSYLIDPDAFSNDNFTVVQEYGKSWLQFIEMSSEKIPADR